MITTAFDDADFSILKYKPSVVKPFYIDMEPTTLLRRFRFLIDLLYGYSVYYMMVDGKPVGYCTITSGRNPRFWFADKEDIIVGPYYVDEAQRGKGYATRLVEAVIKECETDWKDAYVLIKNSNAASIKVTQRLGGILQFYVRNTRMKRLVMDYRGEYGVYRIRNPKKKETVEAADGK